MLRKALVVLSGGQDSTTCLYVAKKAGWEVHAVTFDYNQRHKVEVEAAKIVGRMAEVKTHEIIKLGSILKGTSPLVSNAGLAQYKDHQSLPGGLEKTFVPMRNQLFLTIAANRAYALGTTTLFAGLCQEDYGGYPDCRQAFITSFQNTSSLSVFNKEAFSPPFVVRTPLMYATKRESVNLALTLPGCYEALTFTHTGYDGKFPPTGHDHATLLRAKGFEEANVPDPLVLRAALVGLMDLPDTPNYKDEGLYTLRVKNAINTVNSFIEEETRALD